MKKILKAALIISCVAMLSSVMFGCVFKTLFGEPELKDFTKAGMTITLTSDFTEKDLVNQTAYYTSETVIVTALKEEKSLFEEANINIDTLTEYAELVIENNNANSTVTEENGATYFIYEAEANGKEFKYYASVFKTDDAFWLVQFACEKDDFDSNKTQFAEYASSVKFS